MPVGKLALSKIPRVHTKAERKFYNGKKHEPKSELQKESQIPSATYIPESKMRNDPNKIRDSASKPHDIQQTLDVELSNS